MKRYVPVLGAIGAALILAMPAALQRPTAEAAQVKDAEVIMDAVKISALVTAVDLKNRIVTLKGPEGNEFAVHVDPIVKNLPQLKVGDMVVARYIESVAIEFKKGDGIAMATVIDETATAKAGQKPGAASLTRFTVVTNIWAVNQAKGTVIVRGPLGHFAEVKLKDPKLLEGVKVGDQMQITFTKAFAIGIEKAKA